jgi:hypothetical protein
MKTKWSNKFPTKIGRYWFYGYRYGKVNCGYVCEPELMYVMVRKVSNGFMYVANGQFMFEKEVEEAHFLPIQRPELPVINTELSEEQKLKIIH